MGHTKRQLHIIRLSALALCLLLVITMVPVRASALSGTTGRLNWSLSAGTLTISGSGAMPNYTDANMPPWYDLAHTISRIVVQEGVTSVGSLAFYGCATAQRAALPSTVTAIGDRAFKNCTSLTWVSLPEGLETIGDAAFESCASLNGIILPQSLRTIGSYAFERCTSLSSIVIPSGVTKLGLVVFYHCTGLTRAEIRCPIDKLPDWFFYGCTSLTTVCIPETVTETGDEAFHDCERLSTVYYSGEAVEKLTETLLTNPDTRYAEVVDNGGTAADSGESTTANVTSSSTNFNTETSVSTTVTVTQTEEAVITETTQTEYTYTVNGEEATFEEAMEASGSGEAEVEVTQQTGTTITATVSGSDGWKEVADAAQDASVYRSDNSGVEVDVQLTGSTVNGEDLSGIAGVDAELKVATPEGCIWSIDASKQRSTDFDSEEIDLSFTVELQDSAIKGIESDTVYRVNFASGIDFDAKVGIPLKVSNARQYATIYTKTSSSITELISVVVDENGYAWFPVEKIDPQKDYYVAINEKNADLTNATLPDSMLEDYGVDYVQTLTDASGKQYEVGPRESRWGITGKEFAIYAIIVIAGIVLVVTGLMITLNKISQSRAKYAAMAEADAEYDLDEDALRLQIMQEMLEEARREKDGK